MTSIPIRDVFLHDPTTATIPNDGVAEVEQQATLIDELKSFVCEGQYARGLERVLGSYLRHWDATDQPAVWVSGFYGSGKSHLVKVLRYLWEDKPLGNGASPRDLATLPGEITDQLRELSTAGKRAGGLHAAAGKLEQSLPLRLGVLAILFRSLGLPEQYPVARFVMWMRDNSIDVAVRREIEAAGKDMDRELRNLYVSPVLAQALLSAVPGFAANAGEARSLLKSQYPPVDGDITDQQMLDTIADLLSTNGRMPCALIVLDELQQYIGENGDRAYNVQLITEACSKRFGGRLLFVGTGQSALSGTPYLQKIQARFTVQVELSDTDVEAVTRKLVLAKAPDKQPAIGDMLQANSGEIDRQLAGTKLGKQPGDAAILVSDYPILPVRRRFWERVLRAVDRAGTVGQLRTQLRIVHEAVRAVADRPLGAVVPADFIYDQLYPNMLQSGVLQRNISEAILRHRQDGTPDGLLRSRLSALAYLIGELPREAGSDTGVRATPEMLADLLVDDLGAGGADLRKHVPDVLKQLATEGHLMFLDNEYRIQTPEGAAWEADYKTHLNRISNDISRISEERYGLLRSRCGEALKGLRLIHGKSKVPREIEVYYGQTPPQPTGAAVPVWVRHGWEDNEETVKSDAHSAGTSSPMVFVFLPKQASDNLRSYIAGWRAAQETIHAHGNVPNTDEGRQAYQSMETRVRARKAEVDDALDSILTGARVFQGGGNEVTGATLRDAIEEAAKNSLVRLFPEFATADDPQWAKVMERARRGSGDALAAINHQGAPEAHPVCKVVLDTIGPGKRGNELRTKLRGAPYGWPQDAVDGALLALAVAGSVVAQQAGQPIAPAALDGTKIGVADFRQVNVVFTTLQRIAVRRLLQDIGIASKAGEELTAIPGFVQQMKTLAEAAGGDAPRPTRPDTMHLADLQQQSGNELGVAVYDMRDRLDREIKEWREHGKRIAARLPRWEALGELLHHASGLAIAEQVLTQTEAIGAQRLLLGDPDPVAPLCTALLDALRTALQEAHRAYTDCYIAHMADLEASGTWAKLDDAQRQVVLQQAGVAPAPALRLATEADVLAALKARALREWGDATDALSHRFANALAAAARLLEPTAVHVTLPHRTLNTAADVDGYLAEVRATVMAHIEAGNPVVL